MPKYVQENSSIECEAANIISRSILPNSFIQINKIGKCTTYKCKRNSEATITKELTNPKEAKHTKASKIDLGDSLECEDLFLAVANFKRLKIEVINFTGRHKAQTTNTNCYTFAKITRQIPGIPKVDFVTQPINLIR